MNVCLIYYSKYGNGKEVVEHLGRIFQDRSHGSTIYSISDLDPTKLPEADLYIFSSPTHIGGPPRKVKKFLKKLPQFKHDPKYSLITTMMDPKSKTLQKMESILQPKGMRIMTEGLSINVSGMKGPLESNYQEKLESFATNILDKANAN
jgi:flavodoxin